MTATRTKSRTAIKLRSVNAKVSSNNYLNKNDIESLIEIFGTEIIDKCGTRISYRQAAKLLDENRIKFYSDKNERILTPSNNSGMSWGIGKLKHIKNYDIIKKYKLAIMDEAIEKTYAETCKYIRKVHGIAAFQAK